ncbi:MAG: AI-2E family transporter, partial [Candidatus Methylomirabilales bacterium]
TIFIMSSRDLVRATLTVAATLAGLWALYTVRHVVLLVAIAGFLAVGLEPAVTFLQRLVKSRALAVGAMTILVVFFVAVFLASIVPPVVGQVRNLVENLPSLREQLQDASTPLGDLERRFKLTDRLQKLAGNAAKALSNLPQVFGTVFGIVADLLVVGFLTLYFLLHAPRIKEEGIRLLSPSKRERTAKMAEAIFARVGGWMEGIALISLTAGVVSFVAMLLIGVPYPAALAMWVAVAALIPMVGASLGALLCVIVAFFAGVAPGIATAGFFLMYQQVENYVIAPRIMRRTAELSPATVVISALVGGGLLGPVGVLLAVPGAASLKVLASELWLARRPA